MYSINKNQQVPQPEDNSKEAPPSRFSRFCRDASLLVGSIYGNGYATMYGPPIVKDGIKTYLNAYGPSYVGSNVVNTYTAYTQAATLVPYLGAAGGVVGAGASLLAYTLAKKVASVAVNTIYSAVAPRETNKTMISPEYFSGNEEVNSI